MSAVHEITLNDYESAQVERPSMPKLRLAVSQGNVFITIVQVEETNKKYTQTPIAEVAVKAEDLAAAVALLTDWTA